MFSSVLFAFEFRRSFKSLLGWSLSIGLSMLLVIVLYPMVKDMYSSIPAEYMDFLNSFGGVPNNILEYYATEGVMMLQLFGGIYAVMEGFGAINRDDKEKTVESIYQLPYRRNVFFITKWIRVMVNVILFSLFNYLLSILAFAMLKESIDQWLFIQFNLFNTALFLVMALFGFVLACFLKPTQKSMGAIALPLVLYIISIISQMTNNDLLKEFKYATPFTFADPVQILKEGADFEWITLLIFIGLSIILMIFSYLRYQKREFMV
ncbi:MAG: ABC transporter permease subunit [Candidatus Izemoplasmatales bacterium]